VPLLFLSQPGSHCFFTRGKQATGAITHKALLLAAKNKVTLEIQVRLACQILGITIVANENKHLERKLIIIINQLLSIVICYSLVEILFEMS